LPESRPRKNNPELFKAAPALQAGLWVLAKKPSHESQSKMSIIGAAMRLLLHLIFGVLKHHRLFDPNYQNAPASS
jgi:hypothetical protein